MRDFEYHAPRTLAEALQLLATHGDKARVLAGGTDLVLMMTDRVVAPEHVLDIRTIPELTRYEWTGDGGLSFGAATTFRKLETDGQVRERFPGLAEAASEVGSWQIRNLGTVGGNLCTASPSAEISPILYALEAQVEIAGQKGKRTVPITQFHTGVRRTVLEPDELLVGVTIPAPQGKSGSHYIKLKEREKMDIAFVGVASVVEMEGGDGVVKNARIALGAVAPTPLRASEAEAKLKGQRLTDELLAEAGRLAALAAKPISDVRASAEYRREMVDVLTRRTLRHAQQIAAGR
ncbi:MAG TPA: xanthine dehydrogenase family protein subunit M [Chloroflexota bacterium]|nr:xanthine dehydrogenase family protein subunit M [Chloroflexota bacterium]